MKRTLSCVNTRTDPANCGSCGNSCGARAVCDGGSCRCDDDSGRCPGPGVAGACCPLSCSCQPDGSCFC